MVESKGKIAEVTNATTKQAIVFIGVYSWVIVRNLGRAINKAVHKLPWLFIVITVAISFVVCLSLSLRLEQNEIATIKN